MNRADLTLSRTDVTLSRTDFRIVIPARFASSRLPGKPLADIAGKPLIWHVWQRALETGIGAQQVVIATDEPRIQAAAQAFGAQVVLTSAEHETGTDRLAEVVEIMGWSDDEIVINLQGDEPLIPPTLLQQVADNLAANPAAGIATLCCPLHSLDDVFNANIVKVVCQQNGMALYFSRAPIPWHRDSFAAPESLPGGDHWQRHIGLYGYRVATLRAFSKLPSAPLEQLESLEQLRALWHGIRIHVDSIAQAPAHGVDTQEDLERVREQIARA